MKGLYKDYAGKDKSRIHLFGRSEKMSYLVCQLRVASDHLCASAFICLHQFLQGRKKEE